MSMTRRDFLARTLVGAAGFTFLEKLRAFDAIAGLPELRVGVCDWSIGAKGSKALEMAGSIGLEGVQISPRNEEAMLSYATKEEQDKYADAVKATGVKIAGVGLTLTNRCPLATDPRGAGWLAQTVDAAAALGCQATLIAFFGNGNLFDEGSKTIKQKELDTVIGLLKDAAPHAQEKRIALGLENTLSARDNITIMERVGSDWVQIYYDIANSAGKSYDVPAEIRMLKGRICQFHFKNTEGLFEEGGVNCAPIARAIRETGYKGWLIMERAFGKDQLGYFKRNAAYIRKLFGLPEPAPKG